MTGTTDWLPDGRGVLLLGGSGMLGRWWQNALGLAGVSYHAPGRLDADLARPDTLEPWLRERDVGLVINCAAFSNVDGCEDADIWPTAFRVNAIGVGELAIRCRLAGAKLVHYSTDHVFDGPLDVPHRPRDPVRPVNAYARGKWAGEVLVRSSACEHLILRTSWLYAPQGNNFVRTIADRLLAESEIDVVDDQVGCPTSASHLVDATIRLISGNVTGTLHLTDGGQCTRYRFARMIGRLLGSSCGVRPVRSDQVERAAARPGYSVLDVFDTETIIGDMPGWRRNLAGVIRELKV